VRDLYKVLGIASTADDQRIKSAFRRRAKAVHPDLNPGNGRAEARFIELVQAYEVLSDADARAEYDAYVLERRTEARRRFVHCAGLMAASFMITTASALFVLGLAGANVPYRETWQLALSAIAPANAKAPAPSDSWTTQVAVTPASADPDKTPTRQASVNRTKVDAPSTASPYEPAPHAAKEPRQHVAAAPKASPTVKRPVAPAQPASEDSWWAPAPPQDQRYSLGASDLR
jgi:curved DNA-binding protein CbpA